MFSRCIRILVFGVLTAQSALAGTLAFRDTKAPILLDPTREALACGAIFQHTRLADVFEEISDAFRLRIRGADVEDEATGFIGQGSATLNLKTLRTYAPTQDADKRAIHSAIEYLYNLKENPPAGTSPEDIKKLHEITVLIWMLYKNTPTHIHLFNARVYSPEDYLLEFTTKHHVYLSAEIVRALADKPALLAQYLFHGGLSFAHPENDKNDHRRRIDGIQRRLFGSQTDELRTELRAYLKRRSDRIDISFKPLRASDDKKRYAFLLKLVLSESAVADKNDREATLAHYLTAASDDLLTAAVRWQLISEGTRKKLANRTQFTGASKQVLIQEMEAWLTSYIIDGAVTTDQLNSIMKRMVPRSLFDELLTRTAMPKGLMLEIIDRNEQFIDAVFELHRCYTIARPFLVTDDLAWTIVHRFRHRAPKWIATHQKVLTFSRPERLVAIIGDLLKGHAPFSLSRKRQIHVRQLSLTTLLTTRPHFVNAYLFSAVQKDHETAKSLEQFAELFHLDLTAEESNRLKTEIRQNHVKQAVLLTENTLRQALSHNRHITLGSDPNDIIPPGLMNVEVRCPRRLSVFLPFNTGRVYDIEEALPETSEAEFSAAGFFRIKAGDHYLLLIETNKASGSEPPPLTFFGGKYQFRSVTDRNSFMRRNGFTYPPRKRKPLDIVFSVHSLLIESIVDRLSKRLTSMELTPWRELKEEWEDEIKINLPLPQALSALIEWEDEMMKQQKGKRAKKTETAA